jgi:hypothetical protein
MRSFGSPGPCLIANGNVKDDFELFKNRNNSADEEEAFQPEDTSRRQSLR